MEKIYKPLTDEDRILGKTEPEAYTITELEAFTEKKIYQVKNITLDNNYVLFTGDNIENFLTKEGKIKLQTGEKSVISDVYHVKVYEPENEVKIQEVGDVVVEDYFKQSVSDNDKLSKVSEPKKAQKKLVKKSKKPVKRGK